jgi:hypothetical protein
MHGEAVETVCAQGGEYIAAVISCLLGYFIYFIYFIGTGLLLRLLRQTATNASNEINAIRHTI